MMLPRVFRASTLGALLLAFALHGPRALAAPPAVKSVSEAFAAADHRGVIRLAGEVPESHADYAKAQYLAGESRLVLGEPAEAETAFRAVLAKKPKAVPALTGLGRALSLQAKHEEAEKVLREALALDAKDPAVPRALGEALGLAGQAEAGAKALEAALKLAPSDPLTVRALVEARLRADDVQGALDLAEKLAKASPKHPMGDFLVALARDKQGDAEKAIEAYEAALAKDATFLDAHKNLAILCHARSNTYQDQVRVKKAFEHYEAYFKLGGADERLKKMYATLQQFRDQIQPK